MKKVFARIGMYLTVSDEEYERMKKDYPHEDNLSIEDCKKFYENGWLSALTDYHTDSYIPESIFEAQDFLRWDEIYAAADGKGCLDWQVKVKNNARAYVTNYAMEHFGIDIESMEIPEEGIDEFLEAHPELDRFNEDGQMLVVINKEEE